MPLLLPNLQVAAVTRDGMIVAKTPGTARITAKSGKKSVTITVTVKKAVPTAITGIPAAKTLKKGKSFTLKPVLAPAGVTAKTDIYHIKPESGRCDLQRESDCQRNREAQ